LLGRGLGRRAAAVQDPQPAQHRHADGDEPAPGALNNGATTDEIQAVLLQALVYCGAPATLAAFRTASAAIGEWDRAQQAGGA
jgi:4-carboxymuconolactone decarboxylase